MNKRRLIIDFVLILIACIFTGLSLMIGAAPSGAEIQFGNITVGSDQSKGIDTLVTQTTQKGIINWQSFGIGKEERTHFAQPNASATTLNRVTGGNISEILGQLTATGHILLINPSGVIFGPSARVDVAGLIATTANIKNTDYLNGTYIFNQESGNEGRVINRGFIRAKDNGMIALVAPGVENLGIIEANLGTVILGSSPQGSQFTIDFYGDGLLHFALPSAVNSNIKDAIVQSGSIKANGGKVLLSADTAKGVVDRTINMSGIIEANSVANRNGQIILMGSNGAIAEISGKIKARGERSGEKGGSVQILVSKVGLLDGSEIDVSGQAGGGEALIGGDYKGGGGLPTSEAVYVDKGARILANAEEVGDGGKIIVWSDNATRFYGSAEAKGGPGGGDGGFVETSSKNWLDVNGARVDLTSPKGNTGLWLLDPYDVQIVSSASWGGSWGGVDPMIWTANNGGIYISNVSATDIQNFLLSANVMITVGVGGPATGTIGVYAPVYYSGLTDRTLYLVAQDAISFYANVGGPHLTLDLSAPTTADINFSYDIGSSGSYLGGLHFSGARNVNIGNYNILYVDSITGIGNLTGSVNMAGHIFTTNPLALNTVVLQQHVIIDTPTEVSFNSITSPGGYNLQLQTPKATFYGDVGTPAQPVGYIGFASYTGEVHNYADMYMSNLATNIGTLYLYDGSSINATTFLSLDTTTFLLGNSSISGNGVLLYNSVAGGGYDLTISANNAGDITFNKDIGSSGALLDVINIVNANNVVLSQDVDIYANSFIESAPLYLGGGFYPASITTTNALNFSAPIIVGGSTIGSNTLRGSGITFGSTIGGSGKLMINPNNIGDITFNYDVGSPSTYLSNLTIINANNVRVNADVYANSFNETAPLFLNGNITTTSGLTLPATIVLQGSSALQGNGITFGSTINGAYDLALNGLGGNIIFNGGVGSLGIPVGDLSIVGSGNVYNNAAIYANSFSTSAPIFLAGDITTTTGLNLFAAVTLLGNSILQGNFINFGSTINGAFNLDLIAGSGGDITFSGNVGSLLNPIGDLSILSGRYVYNNADIYANSFTSSLPLYLAGSIVTSSGLIFPAPIILQGSSALQGGGGITFNSTITSSGASHDLVLNADNVGDITFNGAVGSASVPLGNVTIGDANNIYDNVTIYANSFVAYSPISLTGDVITTANLDLLGAVTLLGDRFLQGGSITFGSTVNGSFNLGLSAGSSGDITFNGDVGSLGNSIGAIIVYNANNVTSNADIYASDYDQLAGNGITDFGDSLFLSGGSARIITNRAIGTIDVGALSLLTQSADLYGYVSGLSDETGARLIILLNTIGPGTHFFNGIDLYIFPPAPTAPVFLPASIYNLVENRTTSPEEMDLINYPNFYPMELDTGGQILDYLLCPSAEFECEQTEL